MGSGAAEGAAVPPADGGGGRYMARAAGARGEARPILAAAAAAGGRGMEVSSPALLESVEDSWWLRGGRRLSRSRADDTGAGLSVRRRLKC